MVADLLAMAAALTALGCMSAVLATMLRRGGDRREALVATALSVSFFSFAAGFAVAAILVPRAAA